MSVIKMRKLGCVEFRNLPKVTWLRMGSKKFDHGLFGSKHPRFQQAGCTHIPACENMNVRSKFSSVLSILVPNHDIHVSVSAPCLALCPKGKGEGVSLRSYDIRSSPGHIEGRREKGRSNSSLSGRLWRNEGDKVGRNRVGETAFVFLKHGKNPEVPIGLPTVHTEAAEDLAIVITKRVTL